MGAGIDMHQILAGSAGEKLRLEIHILSFLPFRMDFA